MFLWLSNGQIQRKKGKLEKLRKLNLRLPMCQIMIRNTLLYLEPCLWVMFHNIMVMVTRSIEFFVHEKLYFKLKFFIIIGLFL